MVVLAVCPNSVQRTGVSGGCSLRHLVWPASIAGANTLAADASPPGMIGGILGGLNTMQPIGVLFFLGLGGYLV